MGPEETNTSFEIDDPEEEEVYAETTLQLSDDDYVATTAQSTNNSTNHISLNMPDDDNELCRQNVVIGYAIPQLTIKSDSMDMLTDSSTSCYEDSQTGSSTPTTADVADLTTMTISKSNIKLNPKQQQQQQRAHHQQQSLQTQNLSPQPAQQHHKSNTQRHSDGGSSLNMDSYGNEDNLSVSQATNTTDVDNIESILNAASTNNTTTITHRKSLTIVEQPAESHALKMQTDSRLIPPPIRGTTITASASCSNIMTNQSVLGHKRTQSANCRLTGALSSHSSPSVQMIQPTLFKWMRFFCIKVYNISN